MGVWAGTITRKGIIMEDFLINTQFTSFFTYLHFHDQWAHFCNVDISLTRRVYHCEIQVLSTLYLLMCAFQYSLNHIILYCSSLQLFCTVEFFTVTYNTVTIMCSLSCTITLLLFTALYWPILPFTWSVVGCVVLLLKPRATGSPWKWNGQQMEWQHYSF